jgi:hypothetical protein
VPAPPGQFIEPLNKPVAGPGTVAGDHQPPPVPGRHRSDRIFEHGEVVRGGGAARRTGPRSLPMPGGGAAFIALVIRAYVRDPPEAISFSR